jgi:hypothetical protein
LHPAVAKLLKELFSAGAAKDLIIGALLVLFASILTKEKPPEIHNNINVTNVYQTIQSDSTVKENTPSTKPSNTKDGEKKLN